MIGFNPMHIITKKIKEDYPSEKVSNFTYNNLEKILIRNLKEKKHLELKELRMDIDMRLQHIELTDFDKFISIRLGYYAVVLAVFAIIISSQELFELFFIDINVLIYSVILFITFLMITHNIVTKKQRENLIYYRFKLKCIDKYLLSNF